MGLKQFLGAHAILKALNHMDEKDVLDKYARKQREEILKAFPTRGKKILVAIVEDIIFPYIEIFVPDKITLIGITNRWMTKLRTQTSR